MQLQGKIEKFRHEECKDHEKQEPIVGIEKLDEEEQIDQSDDHGEQVCVEDVVYEVDEEPNKDDDARIDEFAQKQEEDLKKEEKMRYYLELLRESIVEKEKTLKDFKKELQKLYAPKVKIILQILTLQDEKEWKQTSQNPRANVERAKEVLCNMFHLGSKVFDDSFFRNYLRNFQPIFPSEISKMTSKVIKSMEKTNEVGDQNIE